MMLAHLGLQEYADRLDDAVLAAVRAGVRTADIAGKMGTREVGDWIAEKLSRRSTRMNADRTI